MPRVKPCLEVSPKEATIIFESTKANSQSDEDWARVAADCYVLATAEFVTWDEDEAWEDYGIALNWNEYWQRARGWAEAQLSPSEYRKMRDADREDAAERRLKNYFFGGNWTQLPSRAQAALISADRTWNEEKGRRESILNELRIASEEFCYKFIWKPLTASKPSSFDFLDLKTKVVARGSTPSLFEYAGLFGRPYFRLFLKGQELDCSDKKFLTEALPAMLEQLRPRRNDGEHVIGSTTSESTIGDYYRTFLGIGGLGGLPEFARIGRKLHDGRRRAR